MGNSDDDFVVRVAELVVGPETDELSDFRGALELENVSLAPVSTAAVDLPLVVFITGAVDVDLSVFEGRHVLPVSFAEVVGEALPDLSHLTPRTLGTERAARRLRRAAQVDGRQLVAWERLISTAATWKLSSSHEYLLDEQEQEEARTLLAAEAVFSSAEQRRAIGELVASSAERTRTQRRRWQGILAATAAVLVCAIVVAGIGAGSAVTAGRESTDAANAANARRLVSDATTLVGTDPDLPLILAAEANRLSTEPEVGSQVAAIAGSQIPHTAFATEGTPNIVTASASGQIAYTALADGVVRVVDTSGAKIAEIQGEFTSETTFRKIALSPTGEYLAVDVIDQVLSIDVASGKETILADDGTSRLLSWHEDGLLLATGAGDIELIDPVKGDRVALAQGLGEVRAASLSEDGQWMAVSDLVSVRVWNVPERALDATAQLDNVTDVAIANGGDVVMGARFPRVTRVNFAEAEPTFVEDETDPASVGIAMLPTGYFVASGRDGTISIFAPESRSLDPISRFRAHVSDTVRIAGTGDSLVSLGIDGYLRVWDMSGLADLGQFTEVGPQFVASQSELIASDEYVAAAYPSATLRHQITLADDGTLVVSLQDSYGLALRVDPDDVSHSVGGAGLGSLSRGILRRDGSGFIRVGGILEDGGFPISILGTDGDDWAVTPTTEFTLELPATSIGIGPLLADVDRSGNVVVATLDAITVVTVAGDIRDERTYPVNGNPLAVHFDTYGIGEVVTDDGWLRRSAGSDTNLLTVIPEFDDKIMAAEFSGSTLWLLNDQGAIATISPEGGRIIAPPGTVAGAGTLRASSDGELLAHLGADRVTVLGAEDGEVLAQSATPFDVTVNDLAFGTGDALEVFIVTSVGSIARWDMDTSGSDAVGTTVSEPREPTRTEQLAFTLGDDNG